MNNNDNQYLPQIGNIVRFIHQNVYWQGRVYYTFADNGKEKLAVTIDGRMHPIIVNAGQVVVIPPSQIYE